MNATAHPAPPGPGGRRANGRLAAEIRAVLHRAAGPLTPGETAERLGGQLAYSTVVTVLTRLYAKQQLTRTPRGRAYAYALVTDEAGLAARRMRGLLEERPDRVAVLTRFVDGLTSADEDLLRQLLGSDATPDR
jgi:predicted transcriptional regulator